MDTRAVGKAESKLRLAKKTVEELDKTQSFRDFLDQWYVFLVAVKNIYTALEQGAKVSSTSLQWFNNKKQERKNDPLLQYLFQARNSEEHCLDSSVSFKPICNFIGVYSENHSKRILVNGGPYKNLELVPPIGGTALIINGPLPYEIDVKSLDDKPVLIKRRHPTAALVQVTSRGITYYPPKEHLQQPLTDNSPLEVADAAIAYLTVLVEEAGNLK